MAPWLTVTVDRAGHEHGVLSNGRRHIRLDVDAGSLTRSGGAIFHYHLFGQSSAEARLFPLRRFLFLCRHHRFPAALFPADPGIERGILALRVFDALRDNASQREIAATLFGPLAADAAAARGSDFLLSRVRRLVSEAKAMAAGGYRSMMAPKDRDTWQPRR